MIQTILIFELYLYWSSRNGRQYSGSGMLLRLFYGVYGTFTRILVQNFLIPTVHIYAVLACTVGMYTENLLGV
jgi:hypothetical protein